MATPSSRTYIHVASQNSSTNASEFSMNIPEDAVKAKSNEYIRLTLLQHTIINSIYNVTEGNNTLTLTFPNGIREPSVYLAADMDNGYYVSAKSFKPDCEAYRAFNVFYDSWQSAVGTYTNQGNYIFDGVDLTYVNNVPVRGEFLNLSLASPIVPTSYELVSNLQNGARAWTLLGRAGFFDEWTQLDVRTYNQPTYGVFTFTNTSAFSMFRLVIRSCGTSADGSCSVSDFNLRGQSAPQTFQIPPGTYTVSDLAAACNALSTHITVGYEPKLNKYNFTSARSGDTRLSCQGNLQSLLGFNTGDSLFFRGGYNETFISTRIVQPQVVNDLVIQLTHVACDPPTNLTNIGNRDLQMGTNIFAVIPLRAAPFGLNVYHNVTNSYEIDLFDTDPQRIGFKVTDASGNLIPELPHWSAVISVDALTRPGSDPSLERLEAIQEYMRLLFLSAALKDGKNDAQERRALLQEEQDIEEEQL